MAGENKVEITTIVKDQGAQSDLKKLKSAVEDVGKAGAGQSNVLVRAFGQVTSAINTVKNALATIAISQAVVGSIMGIVGKFTAWRDEIRKVKEEQAALEKSIQDSKIASKVEEQAEAYDNLKRKMAETDQARKRADQEFDERLKVQREAEDAQTDADEAAEIAAIDPMAQDADKQRDAVRSRYASQRARRTAERKKHDVVNRRIQYSQEAADARSTADQLEGTLAADEAAISRKRQEGATHMALSRERNEEDISWKPWVSRTAEGNAVRKEHADKGQAALDEVKKMQADLEQKKREIEELRKKAEHAEKMRDALAPAAATADLERETVNVREDADARAKQAEEQRRAQNLATAQRAYSYYQGQGAATEQAIIEQQERKDAAALAVQNAEVAYRGAIANRDSSAIASTGTALSEAKQRAYEVNIEADKAIKDLTKTLEEIKRKFAEASAAIKRNSSQQSAAFSEVPPA